MVNINLTITSADGDVYPLQIDNAEPLSKLKEMVEMLVSIPPPQQALLFNGQPLADTGSIADAQLSDGDLLMAVPSSMLSAQPSNSNRGMAAAQQALARHPDGSAVNPAAFLDVLSADRNTLNMLRAQGNPLADIVAERNVEALQRYLQQVSTHRRAMEEPADPLDPEYQRRMYEAIQQANVQENFETAMEHSPEVFAQVDMLYVDMAVNGEPLKAFIDSGAQMTIMTQACAEKCSIMRLADKRFAGMAVGVGSAKIIGRIHSCALRVGSEHIMTSVTILDQRDGPQFIFGLDNLKRHQCSINLKRNVLEVGSCNTELPFLPAHEVPKDFNTERHRPEGAADELDASGSLPKAIEGDAGVLRNGSTSLPGPAAGTGTSATAGGESAGLHAKAKQLQEITGAGLEQCVEALRLTNGNVDAAAGQLMGF